VKLNTAVHSSDTETKFPKCVNEILDIIIIIIIIVRSYWLNINS
jgi:heme/copper-type cytochrome/quinol oxidase subunit 4